MTKRRGISGWPVAGQASCHTAGEFLAAGQYEQVAELLHEAQVASEQAGDAILAHTLEAARRICLACNQCQAEAEWHRQAYEGADQREQELKQQLHTILDLINGRELSETQVPLSAVPTADSNQPVYGISESAERLSLWQRFRSLLGRKLSPPSSTALIERPAQHFAERVETPTVPLAEAGREAAAASPIRKEQQGEQAPPSLVIYCLGPFRVYNNEQLIEKWPGHKCKSIFKYMIIHRKRPIHREILMDLFWRDADPEAARRNLYQAIYSLRQALQTGDPDFPYILCEDSCYRLSPELEWWVDSEAFTLHYQAGQQLERESSLHEAIRAYELAENLYEGEFLVEDRYEDWSLVHRENLKHKYLDILDRLSQHYFDQGQLAMCITFCQKILTKDNCREDAYRRLMRCYLRQGQCHLALRQYHLCVETLEQELNVPPMPATIELYHEIQKSRVQFPGT